MTHAQYNPKSETIHLKLSSSPKIMAEKSFNYYSDLFDATRVKYGLYGHMYIRYMGLGFEEYEINSIKIIWNYEILKKKCDLETDFYDISPAKRQQKINAG